MTGFTYFLSKTKHVNEARTYMSLKGKESKPSCKNMKIYILCKKLGMTQYNFWILQNPLLTKIHLTVFFVSLLYFSELRKRSRSKKYHFFKIILFFTFFLLPWSPDSTLPRFTHDEIVNEVALLLGHKVQGCSLLYRVLQYRVGSIKPSSISASGS